MPSDLQQMMFNLPAEPVQPRPEIFRDDPPYQRHSPTSAAAAQEVAPDTNRLRRIVLEAIRTNGGLTDEQGMDATGLEGSTYRPRRVELVQRGMVKDSGRTRRVRSGKSAVVWEARHA